MYRSKVFVVVTALAFSCAASCTPHVKIQEQPLTMAPEPADTIFVGGHILTMDPKLPTVEAVAVRGSGIMVVGKREEAMKRRGVDTKVVDLQGKTLLPGFIDAHGSITNVATRLDHVNLSPPPLGTVRSIADIQSELRKAMAARPVLPGRWLVGDGYDQSQLVDKRAPTREELDAVSKDVPIALVHATRTEMTANSAALAAAKITAGTPDPPGGTIVRRAGSQEPTGIVQQRAVITLRTAMPEVPMDERLAMLDRAQDLYASFGVTTAKDGGTTTADMALFNHAVLAGRLKIDVVAYPIAEEAERASVAQSLGVYRGNFKVGGFELVVDGSLPTQTAFLNEPYATPPEGKGTDYRGMPALTDPVLANYLRTAFSRRLQVVAHVTGDAAADRFLDAVAAASKFVPKTFDHRPVLVGGQVLTEAQLARMKELSVTPSFFAAETYFWGDFDRTVLGSERANRLVPAQSALQHGLRVTFANESPIAPPDILGAMWAATARITRSGETLGAEQRVSIDAALRAVTVEAAWQSREEDRKGMLKPDLAADFVILSANPLEVGPDALKNIAVVETIKGGKTIYQRGQAAPKR
ncbi:putative metal-dependent hydrolase with the TIM-barrel fold protein [Labilithrix luteola]|uniref:Putative metal-dependent hydrolase with the TIM-barrel fold protein n=1 Tax=Labilithrix luteola TaxID=1391654 RepID=A0A0K1QF44_9BACT|nr:amidohydrolase [Labilithrix luteola]AKV04055.1 putative metal-dependent hydrolase with the TIM-barrel fold protein [Labilithrix luteola]